MLRKIGQDCHRGSSNTYPSVVQGDPARAAEAHLPDLLETIVQAPLPSLPIERGRAGPALLAHVVVAKFADALPRRQTTIYQRADA